MKIISKIFTAAVLILLGAACNNNLGGDVDFDELISPPDYFNPNSIGDWWVITENTSGSQINYYSSESGRVTRTFDVPDGILSAQAISFDGESLWVGGIGPAAGIYQLNTTNGEVISSIPNVQSVGIASKDNQLYYSDAERIFTLNNGQSSPAFNLQTESEIGDIAIYNNDLLVLEKGQGKVFKLSTSSGAVLNEFYTGIPNATNLSAGNGAFSIITEWNAFCAFETENGSMVNDVPVDLPGIVTGIAPAGPVQ